MVKRSDKHGDIFYKIMLSLFSFASSHSMSHFISSFSLTLLLSINLIVSQALMKMVIDSITIVRNT